MTILSVNSPKIIIADTIVHMVDGLYSLTDIHKASGGEAKHKPAFFLRNEQTKSIITELQICNSPDEVLRIKRGGTNQGTFACKELVYSYAMWISAKFHIFVVRAFDALITRTDAKQREALLTACDKLAINTALRSDIYTMVANHFGYERVTQIPAPLLPEAVAFVYEELLAKEKGRSQRFDEVNERVIRTNTYALVNHMFYVYSWFKTVQEPLTMLNPKLTNQIKGHFSEGMSSAKSVNAGMQLGFDSANSLEPS